MPLISIRETGSTDTGFQAVVSFDNQAEYPVTIQNPFSEQEEARLEWYFEQYLRFPFVRQVEFQAAASSIPTYGEALFTHVFADHRVYALYKEKAQAGLRTLQVEVTGSPDFHCLHWEALKDPDLPQALALHAPMVRKNTIPPSMQAIVRSSPTINLLIITARPRGERDVAYRTISRPLVEGLRQAGLRVHIEILRPGTYEALQKHLEDTTTRYGSGYYHVLHFDVHGGLLTHNAFQEEYEADRYVYQNRYGRADMQPYDGHKAFLFLQGKKDDQADPVEASELAQLLLTHQVPIVILNACQSGKQVGTQETSLGSRLMQAGDYSHSNLSSEAQGLLICLAPFTSVINTQTLPQYTEQLKQQSALAHLPFERWDEVLKEATSWGLLSPHPDVQGFLRLQPIFPYFLRSRLQTVDQDEMRNAVETAFRQHYDGLSGAMNQLLESKEAKKKQLGQALISLEYENLVTALTVAVKAQVSILNSYLVLSTYLDTTQDQRRGLELGETVLASLQTYPADKLAGPLGAEFVGVIDDIANRQRLLKQYAEASYKRALSIWLENQSFDADQKRQRSASIYHNLGRVA